MTTPRPADGWRSDVCRGTFKHSMAYSTDPTERKIVYLVVDAEGRVYNTTDTFVLADALLYREEPPGGE